MSTETTETTQRIPQWTLADKLRKCRYDAKLTQAQMAEALGVHRRSVVAWEQGLDPSLKTLRAYADFANVPVAWFVENPRSTLFVTSNKVRRRRNNRRPTKRPIAPDSLPRHPRKMTPSTA